MTSRSTVVHTAYSNVFSERIPRITYHIQILITTKNTLLLYTLGTTVIQWALVVKLGNSLTLMIHWIKHTGYLHPQRRSSRNDLRSRNTTTATSKSCRTNLGKDTNFFTLLIDTPLTMGYNASHE